MSLYDVGVDVRRVTSDARANQELNRQRDLEAQGREQDARLHKTKLRISRRPTGHGVPGGVVLAGLAIVGGGFLLSKGRR